MIATVYTICPAASCSFALFNGYNLQPSRILFCFIDIIQRANQKILYTKNMVGKCPWTENFPLLCKQHHGVLFDHSDSIQRRYLAYGLSKTTRQSYRFLQVLYKKLLLRMACILLSQSMDTPNEADSLYQTE